MIWLSKINKFYVTGEETLHALKDVDLFIEKGELMAIMGPSGSGKSTLIKILGLLDNRYRGGYFLDGEDTRVLSDDRLSEIRNKRIGFVFQNFNLVTNLTVKENIILPMNYRGASSKEALARVEILLKKVGLEEKIDKYPHELSGGQQQRISIVRAMANNPDIIIADEPTGALDSITSQEIMDIFKELNREGVTIIIITHDINVAMETNRIVEILDGQLKEKTICV